MKDVRSPGGLPSPDKGGSSDADVRTFWCKKTMDFLNLLCVRTDGGGGVEPVGTFCGQGGGGNFSRFCTDVFFGQLLTGLLPGLLLGILKAPYDLDQTT